MTVFNREQFLAEAIESVLAQTWKEFELIIWDDGSTDKSVSIAKHYARQDSRVRFFEASHLGRALALRGATSHMKGVYMGIVDSDDLLMPTALASTAAILENRSNIGMVYTNYETIDGNGNAKGMGRRCTIPYSKSRLLIDFMTFHFRLIRTHLFWEVDGFDRRLNAAQDYDLCLKLSEITDIYHLKKILYRYRAHSNSISSGHQLYQIKCSFDAISNALKRRELTDLVELHLELKPKYSLQHSIH